MKPELGADRRGQVAAIAGVLAVAGAVILLASAQAFLVPQQNERTELDHYERSLDQMDDLRGSILDSARTAAGQTSTVELGPEYRNRFVLQNPAPPSGSFAIERMGGAAISNAVAVNPETRDFWTGEPRTDYPVGSVVYRPAYNYVADSGTTVYENSVLYTQRDGSTTVRSDDTLVDGTDLNLVFLDGNRSHSSSRTVTLEPERVSASDNRVPVRSAAPDEPVVVRVPTQLSEERWRELLADERVANGGHLVSPPRVVDDELVLELEGGVTYDLSLSRVGYQHSVPSVPAYVTVVEVDRAVAESATSEITVEVRDRYDNPVSGVDLRGIQPTVGTLEGPATDALGEVTATTDEDGRARFLYRSPENVQQEDVLSQFSVVAGGIPGAKGEVAFEVSARDTPEPMGPGERRPLVTAVDPATGATASTEGTAGEYVAVSLPPEFDATGYTLDLENGDRSVVNTVPLDSDGLLTGATAQVYQVGGDDLVGTTSLATLLRTDDRGARALYVVGPSVTDLAGFAHSYGLTEGDVVLRSDATGLVTGGFTDADADPSPDLLADDRGTVVLRDAAGGVADSVSYRSGPAGTIDTVVPRVGADDDAEYVGLTFDRPVDLTGATLSVDSDGVNETVPLDAFAADLGTGLSGPLYVIGTGIDPATFAAERGVAPERVRPVTDLAGRTSLASPDDVLDRYEGELTLTVGDRTVDRYEYEDRALASIDDAVPVRDGTSTDEYVALTFDAVDTTGWSLAVDDVTTTETLDLSPLAPTTSVGRGPTYLVGTDVDRDAFATENDVPVERVVRLPTLADDLSDDDVLPDEGASLALRDGAGDTVDTLHYDGDDGASIAAADPTRGGDATDEFARLEFGLGTDTTGWTLTVEDTSGAVRTVPLTGVSDVASGPLYLVGDGTDVGDVVDAEGVDPSRVVRYRSLDETLPADLFPSAGATLTLRDAEGDTVDRLAYAGTVTAGEITDLSPTRGGDATREHVELSFDRPVDTTDWTLVTESGDGSDTRRVEYHLSPFAGTTASSGPVYLVGDAVDVSGFAASLGVSTARVARFDTVAEGGAVTDALRDAGAELSLVRDDGVVVDREAYGTESRPGAESTVDVGQDGTDRAVYREVDDNGDHVDTDRADDWYYSDTDPTGEGPPVQAGPVTYDEGSVATAPDGTLSFDVTNAGDADAEVVGFAVETTLAPSLDAGTARELAVVADSTGYVNDRDGGFATSGATYAFEADDYDGVAPTVAAGETAAVELGAPTGADGEAVDAGSLVASTAAEADLSVTLVLDDGTTETFHFRQRPADLSADVTAVDEVVAVGADAEFEVSLSNGGPGRAAGPVTVTDVQSAGLTVESATASVGRYDAETGEWTLRDGLAPGETATLSVDATAVDAAVGDTVRYEAALTDSGSPDDDPSNDADEATVSVGGADLVVTHAVDPEPVEQGGTATLTVTVANRGPADNGGPIEVGESLPEGLTYVSDTPSVGRYDPDTGVWTIPDGLAGGETVTLEVEARAELAAPTEVTAAVADTGPIADGDDGNDDATVTVEVGPCSDYVRPGESVLLYETFETSGTTATERLVNSQFDPTGAGVAGVDDVTSTGGEDCTQSAYHADGAGSLVSDTVDTARFDQVVVGFWVREGDSPYSEDPQAGEDLFVEYRNADGEWVEMEEFNASATQPPADGSARERVFVLPAEAATHDAFAVRFRQEAGDRGTDDPNTVLDYWHVDDVYVLGSASTGDVRPFVSDVERVGGDESEDGDDGSDEEDDGDDSEYGDDERDEEDSEESEDGDDTSASRYEATFGYESTYERPVVLPPGDANELTPDRYDAPVPATFAPGRNESAVVVPALAAGDSVTWTLAGRSVTAYGRVADLAVSMTTDDAAGSTIEGQVLTYRVTVTNEGDPTGPTAGDAPGPVVLDVAIPVTDGSEAISTLTTTAGAGDYDAADGTWTLPDGLAAGESVTLEVLVKLESSRETTSRAAIASRTTADTVPENDADSVTLDPYPVTCRDVAYVAPDGRTVRVLTPRGDTRTLGEASEPIDILGPYTNLDDDEACEAVYVAGGDGEEDNLYYVDDDGTERSIEGNADVSKSALAVGDVDGDGAFSVLYADNDEQNLYRVEVEDGVGGRPVTVDGSVVPGDSGGVGYTDVTGDGVNDTLFVDSATQVGIVDGETDTVTTVRTDHDTVGGGPGHHALGPPRPVDGRPARIPVVSDGDITLTAADGGSEVVYGGSDVHPTRFTLRDWDFDGEWEFLFLTAEGRVKVYDPGSDTTAPLTEPSAAQTNTGVQ